MRLIDADELKKELTRHEPIIIFNRNYDGLLADIINNAPTVEPTFKPIAEVKFDKEQLQEIVDKAKAEILESVERPQGEWVDTGDMQEYWAEEYQCSICGAKDHWHNFCPNCGAEMKGGEEE